MRWATWEVFGSWNLAICAAAMASSYPTISRTSCAESSRSPKIIISYRNILVRMFLCERTAKIAFNFMTFSSWRLYFRTSPADQRDQVRHTNVVSRNENLSSHNMAVQVNRITIKSFCVKKYSFILSLINNKFSPVRKTASFELELI